MSVPLVLRSFYCTETHTYRNLPRKDAERFKRSAPTPPSPPNSNTQGGIKRYKIEYATFLSVQTIFMEQLGRLENLAFAVDMALYPDKRRKAIHMFQKMNKKSPEMKALKRKLALAREEVKKRQASKLNSN